MEISQQEIDEVFDHNPLEEVSFEVRFPINLRIISNIYEVQVLLGDSYPLISREAIELESGLSETIYVFENTTQDQQMRIGEKFFTVIFYHYESFEKFLNEINKVSNIFFKAFSITTLSRVGLRYVNVIKSNNKTELSFRQYVKPTINFPITNRKKIKGFISEVLFQTDKYFLNNRTVFFPDNEQEEYSYILDIDAFTEETVVPEKLSEILNNLHKEIQLDFLNHITEDYKNLMRQTKE